MTIYKVQRPLGGNILPALVYNRDRSFNVFVPFADVAGLFDAQRDYPPKLYVEGEVVGGALRVIRIVPPQDW